MPNLLRLFTSNALATKTNTITGITNSAKLTEYNRRSFSSVTSTVTSVSSAFDSYAATEANKYTFNISFSTSLTRLYGLTIGPNTMSEKDGYVLGIKLNNTAASGLAGYYKGNAVNYNELFVIPPISGEGGYPQLTEGWEPYSLLYAESGTFLKSYKFNSPGIPILFDSFIANVKDIDVYIAQSGSLVPEMTFAEFIPEYFLTVGSTGLLGLPPELFDNAPNTNPSIVSSNNELIMAYMSVFDETEQLGGDAEIYADILSIVNGPQKGLTLSYDNSSSTFEVGGYTAQKDPSRTRNTYKIPINFVDNRIVSRLQNIMYNNSTIVLTLYEANNLTKPELIRERDFCRYVRLQSPIAPEEVQLSLNKLTLTLEEI